MNKQPLVYMIDVERWEVLDDFKHADREVLAIVVCPATRKEKHDSLQVEVKGYCHK